MTTRRDFLKTLSLASAGVALGGGSVLNGMPLGAGRASGKVKGEKVKIAYIGIGNRGEQIIQDFARTNMVEVVALCDVDMGAAHTRKVMGMYPKAKRFKDFRKLFDETGKEFDAVAQNGEIVEYAISEHIEFAGVHSGDATLVFPAQKIYFATARRIKQISRRIAKELNISGPFNIQYLARNNEVKVIECNLRASRSFPFVSKVLKRNFIETATRIMLDAPYTRPDKSAYDIDWIGVKASQFSFSRLHKADPVLGVDMSSTGEVGCLGDSFDEALLNAMIAVGFKIPQPEKGVMFSSGAMKSKVDLLDASRMLHAKGYKIYATAGTSAFLNAHGVETTPVYWPDEKPDAENNVMRMIANHAFDLIVNIPKNHTKRELTNGYKIRRAAIDHNIPLITNARLAGAFIEAFCNLKPEDIAIKSWQEYK